MERFDAIVVGAGIAGAGVAAMLAPHMRVAVLEAEPHASMHATGRSAAIWSGIYGNDVIRALTGASRAFFDAPPPGFTDTPLLSPRASLYIATADQVPALNAFRLRPGVAEATQLVDAVRARELCPALRPGHVAAALLEPGSADIDVDLLLQGWLKMLRRHGSHVRLSCPVDALDRAGDNWVAVSGQTRIAAPVLINAAGAWADRIAAMAGLDPIGLTPYKRTVALVDVGPAGLTHWPAVIDIDEAFYFKPDAGALLLSPADETPSGPHDAYADDLDVAIAVDRVERATDLRVRMMRRSWAGLRTFAPDRTPVIGFDRRLPSFFWLAGQGGYGVQTAPAISRLAAALVRGEGIPPDLIAQGIDPDALTPGRFAMRGTTIREDIACAH